jgi:uncharacterized coiled-coil DUF342 family protein
MSKPNLSTQLRDLTAKLRSTIAQANRHYERCKQLELEVKDLRAMLEEHGIEVPDAAKGIGRLKAAFQRYAAEVGYPNVRIHGGILQVRGDDNNWETVDA